MCLYFSGDMSADVLKTRLMGSERRESLLTVLRQASRSERVPWMLKGWLPGFIRLGPQTILTMIFFEQHKKVYQKWQHFDYNHVLNS
jgi:dicarboxylate transporter 10